MFEMNEVGKRIAELRKRQNMTQLELADRLGISYQAVSNWERGGSMPDISKLPEIAFERIEEGGIDSVKDLFPFMNEEDITKLARILLK